MKFVFQKTVLSTFVFYLVLSPVTVQAQPTGSEDESLVLEEVSVLGSRRSEPRSAIDAVVPVDVISSDDLLRQGSTDVIDVLTSVIPAFNANREPISDAATLVRPVNLRGLAADQTLVLVNGKRRHRGAVIGEFVSGLNRGAQAVDVSALFGAALKQVEVLRDGAAAQYGSDAIAGVINFALQDDPNIRSLSVQYGEAFEGDGAIREISGAFGISVGRGDGYAVLAFQAKENDPSSRGVQDGEGTNSGAAGLTAAGFPVPGNPVVVWGAPEVKDDYKLIINAGVPINDNVEIYTFGNFATRKVNGSFFYRNPTGRTGVYVDGSGNTLFADITGAGGCPVGALPTSSFADAQAFLASAPSNCFSFNSILPGGFTPRFGGVVEDYSFAAGVRGEFGNGMSYDLSVNTGENNLEYQLLNSINASLGPDTPFEFDLGAQIENDTVVNADFSKGIPIEGLVSDLNVAFGLQYHDESFEIAPGQLESYLAGPFISQGFSAGSNGFQGFSPAVSGEFSRDSISGYIDLEADITDRFLLSAAIRYEDFSDFGTTTNGKLAARFSINDSLALRAAVSTGFRAPSVGQSNLQRSATGFSNGQLVEQLVVASTSALAQRFGGQQLDAEDAVNLSIGFTATIGEVELTMDYFDIDIEKRIAQITANLTQQDRDALVAQGVSEAATVSQVSFFVNDFDTNTFGVDIVANYGFEWLAGDTDITFAFNYTNNEITDRGATITDGRAREIENAVPDYRYTLSFNHQYQSIKALLRVNYYDDAYESLFNDTTLPVVTEGLFLVDAEVEWEIDESYRVAIGAKNLFDEYPDEWSTAGFTGRDGGFLGAIYPLNHPAGLGGGAYYVRLNVDF